LVKIFIIEKARQNANHTTLHFDHEGLTCALTNREGTSCVTITAFPWFAVYNGRKRISLAISATKALIRAMPLSSSAPSRGN
jgi:hypothetical protein